MSELCCTRLAGNTGRKNHAKSPSVSHHTHHFVELMSYIFATKALIDNWKKILSSNISSRCPHNIVKFGPLTAEIGSGVWGTPANFNGFRVLALLLQRCHSLEANQTLHDVCPFPGLVHFIHFRELLPRDGILPGAKFTLCPKSCVPPRSYIGSVTARHSSSRRQPKFAACYKEWNCGTFAEGATYIQPGGHHVGHRPTFSLHLKGIISGNSLVKDMV